MRCGTASLLAGTISAKGLAAGWRTLALGLSSSSMWARTALACSSFFRMAAMMDSNNTTPTDNISTRRIVSFVIGFLPGDLSRRIQGLRRLLRAAMRPAGLAHHPRVMHRWNWRLAGSERRDACPTHQTKLDKAPGAVQPTAPR